MPTSATPSFERSRGALTGTMISGAAGIAWAQWAASGLSGTISIVVRVVAVVAGVFLIVRSARLRRAAVAGSDTMFTSRAYLLVVVAEGGALVGGAELLNASGEAAYVAAWFAIAVGVHFIGFGRLFHASFYGLGAAILLGGVAGAVVGLAGGGQGGVEATSGLIAAVSLLAGGGWRTSRAGG
ncbi:MAG: hypothetical protein ACR2MN_01485 [Acidimicrobiales bacterium]